MRIPTRPVLLAAAVVGVVGLTGGHAADPAPSILHSALLPTPAAT